MSSQSSLEVIRMSGELDVGRRDEVRAALQAGASSNAILLDLGEATYADSTVIAELLRFRNDVDAGGRRLALLIGSPRLARVLQYAGLSDAFHVFTDRGEALSYLSGMRPA